MFKAYLTLILLFFLIQSCKLYQKSIQIFQVQKNLNSFNNRELDDLLKQGFLYLGVPYRVGGMDKSGLDCSGLLFSMYQNELFQIPRTTLQQSEFGLPVSINQVKKGDWVFFSSQFGFINHVGIISNINKDSILFLHASTSKGVREDELTKGYWHNLFVKAIRPFKRIKF